MDHRRVRLGHLAVELIGDPLVEFRHLKQPASEVGPFSVAISQGGYLTVAEGTDLPALRRQRPWD